MKTSIMVRWLLAIALFCTFPISALAQQVTARISTREAWVGAPVVLQIKISDAKKFTLPKDFEIEGCDVKVAGAPSQSSRITIYNGRRSESRTVTQHYLVTPKREGRFTIPALEVVVDGEKKTTPATTFVANKSETGDLLFVEVEGSQKTVFVGQSLDLKLKIWIRPFTHRDEGSQPIKLSEANMWQLISAQTSWGTFFDRLKELAENRERPSGKPVLRADGSGRQREYYLYEIETTVYPTKTGKIEASDLEVEVNYPVELGLKRNSRNSLFSSRSFGGGSLLGEMMRDDFFGPQLAITKSRPVKATANVDSTQVIPIPTENRPADYRGAVGQYQIVTQAELDSVVEGDPITLRIGVIGDGPMELVQAPPLSELSDLTADFQVADQALAGFVQDQTKVFITTIRPRNSGVTQIPAIPFTFFDPKKKAYETVYSKPIDIEVEEAESLGLDAIVGGAGGAVNSEVDGANLESESQPTTFDFSNVESSNILAGQLPPGRNWWWSFAIVPPVVWLTAVVAQIGWSALLGIFALRPASKQALNHINNAKHRTQLTEALRQYVAKRSKVECPTMVHAVGQVRQLGAYEEASKLESFTNRLGERSRARVLPESNKLPSGGRDDLAQLRSEAIEMVERLERAFGDRKRLKLCESETPTSSKPLKPSKRPARSITSSVIALMLCSLGTAAAIAQPRGELEAILSEATQAYQLGVDDQKSDPANAKRSFAIAAQKYQALVDCGVRNSDLFFNLGNALNRSGDPKRSVLNYYRALWLNPAQESAQRNLAVLEQYFADLHGSDTTDAATDPATNFTDWPSACSAVYQTIGSQTLQIVFAVSSILFWLLLLVKTFLRPLPLLRWAVVPLVMLLVCGAVLNQVGAAGASVAIVMSDEIEIKSGDGVEFPTVKTVKSTAGQAVEVMSQRNVWRKVRMPDGTEGWLPEQDLAMVEM